MESERELQQLTDEEPDPKSCYLQKFRLYETRSNFYMIGRDKNRTVWRVLKIDRLEPSELSLLEDTTTYSEIECYDLLRRIHEGNQSTGGLKFVTTCYGIVGFIKFLGPYYMLLITKRRKIGVICGHTIYGIAKSEMIPIPNPTVRSKMAFSKNENRYKRLLWTVDLTKDFFFSYSYHVMRSVQKNVCDSKTGEFLYETMFVWNEFLTRGIRKNLKNTLWTVALVYGFFKQVKLSASGRDFNLTIIARRSRHYAGTRYLKRGVNEEGKVANDVEMEQIVFEDTPDGCPTQISSVVQNRGSIPLFWSQETSRLNPKPDITLSRKDPKYEATRLHFENLVTRYGNPILILNLIKTHERKPRESILRAEFLNAIRLINKSLSVNNRLKFLHWDLHRHSTSKDTNVLEHLGKVAAHALNITGIFFCRIKPNLEPEELLNYSYFEKNYVGDHSLENLLSRNDVSDNVPNEVSNDSHSGDANGDYNFKPPMFQKGVLRTNCIDCLDRTNVAQYAYGLVALGQQLHALGVLDSPTIDLDNPLAEDLMGMYEGMGDTLALQYGGSAAHNKIFSARRGQWKAASQSQEFIRTIQRFYSNTCMDPVKQNAIDVFLGYMKPQPGKPELWELDSDQHYNVGSKIPNFADENIRSFIKRSLSDGNITCTSDSPTVSTDVGHGEPLSKNLHGDKTCLSESTPEISTCESDISYCRFTPSMPCRQLFRDMLEDQCPESDHVCYDDHGDACTCSNFLDTDWVSSSGNSCEYETRSIASLSSENVVDGLKLDTTTSSSEARSSVKEMEKTAKEITCNIRSKCGKSFDDWVAAEDMHFF